MLKLFPLIFAFFLFGCCTSSNFTNSNSGDGFVGIWHAGNVKEATLKILPQGNKRYSLKFINGDYKWEGVGYRNNNKIIAIFRYTNVDQQGFVTFILEGNKRLSYVSRNSDGSIRARNYYIKNNPL